MKIFHNEEIYIKTDNFSDSIFKENTMFFDIETTGFSPVKAIVYMIGCARRIKNRIVIDQYFAESVDDEAAVIEAFAGSLSGCSTIISFNGVGFDIPFLKNKYKKYKQDDPFCNVQILDIFKELSPIKPLLCLENYKQKSIEAFLGIDREDKYSGGELINVYYEYLAQKDDEKLSLLLTHNYEDVLGMTKLLSILSYKECIHGIADITGVSVNPYTAYDGSLMNELIISFENKFSVPKSVSFHDNDIYVTIGTTKSYVRAEIVDHEYREKCKAYNCYVRKTGTFIRQYSDFMKPEFRFDIKDKYSYFMLTDDFINSKQMVLSYVKHITDHLFNL